MEAVRIERWKKEVTTLTTVTTVTNLEKESQLVHLFCASKRLSEEEVKDITKGRFPSRASPTMRSLKYIFNTILFLRVRIKIYEGHEPPTEKLIS